MQVTRIMLLASFLFFGLESYGNGVAVTLRRRPSLQDNVYTIRSSPSHTGDSIGSVFAGEVFRIVDCLDNYYYLGSYGNIEGYLYGLNAIPHNQRLQRYCDSVSIARDAIVEKEKWERELPMRRAILDSLQESYKHLAVLQLEVTQPNTVGGVNVSARAANTGDKIIKYVKFHV